MISQLVETAIGLVPAARPSCLGIAEVIGNDLLSARLQPILDCRLRSYLGFEGLMRGPEDTALHMPTALLAAAVEENLLLELECAALDTLTRAFVAQGLPGKLFLNASPSTFACGFFSGDRARDFLLRHGIAANRIVLEVTEAERIEDYVAFGEIVREIRGMGFLIAIDDLGEGFASLRLWSEVRPDFVKIDRHFVDGADTDPLKFQLVRSIVGVAESCHATVIAEGIETAAILTTLRDIGVPCVQGYLVSRPEIRPDPVPSVDVLTLLQRPHLAIFPSATAPHSGPRVSSLMKPLLPCRPDTFVQAVFERFHAEPDLNAVPVVDDNGAVLGVIQRHTLLDQYLRPFGREIYGRKPATLMMDSDPLLVDTDLSVQSLGQRVASLPRFKLQDCYVVTVANRYLGIGLFSELLAAITELQVRAARYANPLTQLPGNVPLDEHMDRLLSGDNCFVACYADLDHFKPYNDVYGYRRGDDLIQLLAEILREAADSSLDFVGHIGGDDFAVIFQSDDWEERCQGALAEFDRRRVLFLDAEHVLANGYESENRQGQRVWQPIPSLSLGIVRVAPHTFAGHRALSFALATAKKMAKRLPGSSLFIDRRQGPGLRGFPADPGDATQLHPAHPTETVT